MKVTFNTRAALGGEVGPAWVVLPAASVGVAEPPPTAEPLVAEPPMAAAEPLSLPRQVRFKGFLVITESDMIEEGGE